MDQRRERVQTKAHGGVGRDTHPVAYHEALTIVIMSSLSALGKATCHKRVLPNTSCTPRILRCMEDFADRQEKTKEGA